MWHQECKVHWHRNRLSAEAYRCQGAAQIEALPGLGGADAGIVGWT